MTEKKPLLEEAVIQMKNLEELIAENAKGILASTMRQEIKDLVKESLNEQDEDDDEVDMSEPDMDVEDDLEIDTEDDESDVEDDELDMDIDMDDKTYDIRHMDKESVMKIFSALDPNDEVEVVPDEPGRVHFKDKRTNKEYYIMTESDLERDVESAIETTFDEEYDMMENEMYEDDMVGLGMEKDETIYELEMDEDSDYMSMDEDSDYMSMDEDSSYEEEYIDFPMDEMYKGNMDLEENDETIYELEMDEDSDYMSMDEDDEEETIYESKMKSTKPKGMGFGKPSYKFSDKPNMDGGFKVISKNADKTMGTGSAKSFKYGKGENLDGEFKIKPKHKKETKVGMMSQPKKMETKEASRTLGNGKYWGREGLPKPRSAPRHLRVESVESQEVELLKEKNEEYRKALNIFRTKLNEVAVFNSNLAYATRLFTEHSTSKQEKLNILKRFDGVETIKESKNLYKTIKDELTVSKPQQVTESFERTIQKSPSNGSAINLIESKTYENPQFLRMKDLMSKLK